MTGHVDDLLYQSSITPFFDKGLFDLPTNFGLRHKWDVVIPTRDPLRHFQPSNTCSCMNWGTFEIKIFQGSLPCVVLSLRQHFDFNFDFNRNRPFLSTDLPNANMIFRGNTQSQEQGILNEIQELTKQSGSLSSKETRSRLLQLSEQLSASLRAPEDVANEVAYYVSTCLFWHHPPSIANRHLSYSLCTHLQSGWL